jgi:trans-aconitate 2-methyltransferase
MALMSWSARQYTLFEAERTRPVRDLLTALPAMPDRDLELIDLGCGPGNSTAELAARFPGAALRGMDSSPDMLEAARQRLPGIRFDLGDIADWADPARGGGESFDVILANAVLQWLPRHDLLLPAMAARLKTGGALAVQMPDNLDEPAHRLMREIAAEDAWSAKLGAVAARPPMAGALRYYDWLTAAGCSVDVWRTVYHHPLAGGTSAVVEWFKGSGLRPYIAALDEDQREAFLARYERELARLHPPAADGSVLLPFPRLFILARL